MNTIRIATSLLLLIGGLTGCMSRSVADSKSLLLTTAQQLNYMERFILASILPSPADELLSIRAEDMILVLPLS